MYIASIPNKKPLDNNSILFNFASPPTDHALELTIYCIFSHNLL